MHAVCFALKRAYQGSLSEMGPTFAKVELTPARFDLLYAVFQSMRGKIWQSRLRRVLGVTAPTVSRMVRSLERLGFVERKRWPGDSRQRNVSLTEKACACIRRVTKRLFGPGGAQHFVNAMVAGRRWWRAPSHTFCSVAALEDALNRVRIHTGDGATLAYLWHPDD